MEDLVGALMDSGYSPTEVREMVGPILSDMDDDGTSDLGSHVLDLVHSELPAHNEPSPEPSREPVVKAILEKARDSRKPPGPQVVVVGVANSLPQSAQARAIRVDTEDSYQAFRRSAAGGYRGAGDTPEDVVEALSSAAEDELLGADFERGYASQVIGNIMDMRPASQTALHNNPEVSADQSCLICGVNEGSVVCRNCRDQLPTMLGLFDRGYASQVIGLFDRGPAASLYDDNPSTTIDGDILGVDAEEFYRLQRMSGGESQLVGAGGGDGFYRMPRHERYNEGLSSFIGDVMALSVPSTVYAEQIPLSFHSHNVQHNAAGWKQGNHIYGSIRVTGWDGQPRILTGATPYAKEIELVVGYSSSASIPPSHSLAVIDPLARQLGASRIFPRLAASAPAVLRISRDKLCPLVLTAMPAGKAVDGSWV